MVYPGDSQRLLLAGNVSGLQSSRDEQPWSTSHHRPVGAFSLYLCAYCYHRLVETVERKQKTYRDDHPDPLCRRGAYRGIAEDGLVTSVELKLPGERAAMSQSDGGVGATV